MFYNHNTDLDFYHRATWERKFTLLPQFCALTKKLLWFKFAMKGSIILYGPGLPIKVIQWHDEYEHLNWIISNAEI